MCGIFGICYTGDKQEDFTPTELAQILFPAIRHRGPHAFGWMTWDGTETGIQITKHVGDVGRNVNLAHVTPDNAARWMVGHVRYATNGKPEFLVNDHPIVHQDIVGVHNGVIRNHAAILAETGRQDPNASVDSEAIFAAVNKWGHRAGLRRMEGNMVTVYSRFGKPEFIYIARQGQYKLTIARTRNGNLVFASELGVLRAVWGQELHDIRQLKENQLLRIADGRVVESVTFRVDSWRAEYEEDAGVGGTAAPRSSSRLLAPPRAMVDRWLDVPIPPHRAELFEAVRRANAANGLRPIESVPKHEPTTSGKRRKTKGSKYRGPAPRGYVDGDEVRPGKFYYNGLLMDEDEYVRAVADECGFGDD